VTDSKLYCFLVAMRERCRRDFVIRSCGHKLICNCFRTVSQTIEAIVIFRHVATVVAIRLASTDIAENIIKRRHKPVNQSAIFLADLAEISRRLCRHYERDMVIPLAVEGAVANFPGVGVF